MQVLYDSAIQHEASSDWVQSAEKWKACVNETLRQTEECRVQCVVASQRLPEDRGVDSVSSVYEKAASKKKQSLTLSLLTRQKEKETIFSFPSSSFSLAALVPAVLCYSGSHTSRKDFCSGGLPAHTTGASAHCTV